MGPNACESSHSSEREIGVAAQSGTGIGMTLQTPDVGVRLEQADDLFVGRDSFAMKDAALGLHDDPLNQRTIVAILGLP
jgi:hypothetical protein